MMHGPINIRFYHLQCVLHSIPMPSFFWIHNEDNKQCNFSMQFVPASWYPPTHFLHSPYKYRPLISKPSTDVLPLTLDAVFHTSKKQRQEKFQGIIYHERTEREYSYISTLSLTLTLDDVGGQYHVPALLPLGKIRYPWYSGWVSLKAGLDGMEYLFHSGILSPVQPAASGIGWLKCVYLRVVCAGIHTSHTHALHMYVHAYIHTYTLHTCIHTYIHMHCIRTYMHTYTYTLHTCIYIYYIHTYIHTRMHAYKVVQIWLGLICV